MDSPLTTAAAEDPDFSAETGTASPPADPVSQTTSRAAAAAADPAAPGPMHQPWLDDDVLVLPSPLSPHALCPVIGCGKSYANQTQDAIRQSLMRHLKSGYHADLSVSGSEWRCAACRARLPRRVTAHRCPLGPLPRVPAAALPSVRQECHWCSKWFPTRRGLINHRQCCPRRPLPRQQPPTDWTAALARLREEVVGTAPTNASPAPSAADSPTASTGTLTAVVSPAQPPSPASKGTQCRVL